MGERSIRFGITDGSGRRAATWKCWTPSGVGKSDVYLSPRELGYALKASLHQTGNWHVAFSRQFLEENLNTFSDKPSGRFIEQWSRPQQIAPGVTLAFRIVTPHSAVSIPFDVSLYKGIAWIPAPPDNRAVEIDIIFTAPDTLVSGWPGKNSMNTQLIDSMSLSSGEKVWVVHRVTDMPNLGTLHGTSRYFKGKSKDDLIGAGLHIHVFGHEKDGSCVIYDCAAEKRNSSN